MTVEKLDFSVTGSFSPIFLDYVCGTPDLQAFYKRLPTLESFQGQMEEKQFSDEQRAILVEVLQEQYHDLKISGPVRRNMEYLLDSNTYTVTTGHQLNIFMGPLYFVYKIVTVINLCKKLKETFPDQHFVPVYWMASEDHDFEEINHFNLFGRTYEWQTHQQGAVGRFHPNGMREILEALPESVAVFEHAYRSCPTLADATRCYVNELFGKEGLVVVDADHPKLKASLRKVIEDDLFRHHAKKQVEDTSAKLDEMGYKTQVHPREINFFYLREQMRERIVYENGQYKVINTDLTFSQDEIRSEISTHPERFSPNVILRPLYQEMILPNLAYVGGPAEVAYWLQLKAMFDHYEVPFPILLPRNFALIINKSNHKKLQKLPVQIQDLFLDIKSLTHKFIEDQADGAIKLTEEKEVLENLYQHIREKVLAVDKGLDGFMGAETTKAIKSLSGIEKKLRKAEERNQETAIKQLESLKEKLFPDGSLQERKENFMNFYINDPAFIDKLLKYLDPLDFRFNILSEPV